jgi:hypothetical protein
MPLADLVTDTIAITAALMRPGEHTYCPPGYTVFASGESPGTPASIGLIRCPHCCLTADGQDHEERSVTLCSSRSIIDRGPDLRACLVHRPVSRPSPRPGSRREGNRAQANLSRSAVSRTLRRAAPLARPARQTPPRSGGGFHHRLTDDPHIAVGLPEEDLHAEVTGPNYPVWVRSMLPIRVEARCHRC